MVDREAVLQELPVYLPDVDLGRVARGSLILLGCLLNLRGRGDGLLVWQAEDLKERGRNVPQVLQLLLLALGLLGKVLAQAAEAVAADFFLQEAGQKRGVEELAGLWHFLKLESQQLTQAHVLAQVGRKQPHGLQLVQGLEQVAQTAIQLLLQKGQGRGISQDHQVALLRIGTFKHLDSLLAVPVHHVLHGLHETGHVGKLTVNAGKADVGHVVDIRQLVHHQFANFF